ncbi:MAG: polyprenyl synthetase family protein [Ruminococcaceae bacterium]|nr:polyprenyl synthetase family protein [Oscillospiraceae bacterium]
MTYDEQHAVYLARCDRALSMAVQRYFSPTSKVSEAAEYTLMNGGKRVRGVLTLAACDLLAGDIRMAEVFAAAIEMIHAFSLIHDDLPCMDDDDMRRGKPAAHIVYGEATALLAGDLLAIEAFEAIAAAPYDAKAQLRATAILAKASGAGGMIFGQELDLKYETQRADEATLHEIHTNKTGALIKASIQLGMAAALTAEDQAPALLTYAENIGLVFQIIDDILDVTATPEQLGKPTGSDARKQKSTFVTLYGFERSQKEAARLTVEAVTALRQAYGDTSEFLCQYAEQLGARIH